MLTPAAPPTTQPGQRCSGSGVPRQISASRNPRLNTKKNQKINKYMIKNPPYRWHRLMRAPPSSCGFQRSCAVRQLRTLCLLPPAAPGLWAAGILPPSENHQPGPADCLSACLPVYRQLQLDTLLHKYEILEWAGRVTPPVGPPLVPRRSAVCRPSPAPNLIQKPAGLTRRAAGFVRWQAESSSFDLNHQNIKFGICKTKNIHVCEKETGKNQTLNSWSERGWEFLCHISRLFHSKI